MSAKEIKLFLIKLKVKLNPIIKIILIKIVSKYNKCKYSMRL